MTAPAVAELAEGALAFEAKLRALPGDLHADWQRDADSPWALLLQLPEGPARERAAAGLFAAHCGPLPALPRLLDAAGAWVLQDRPTLTRLFCALAIARRPGVLRCCIEKSARLALRAALGEWFGRLAALAPSGRGVPAQVAHWSPMHWACIGYWDWATLLQPDDGPLRRMARLSLPRGLLGTGAARGAAAPDWPAAQALAWLGEEEAVPC